jgi:hypothetical protein
VNASYIGGRRCALVNGGEVGAVYLEGETAERRWPQRDVRSEKTQKKMACFLPRATLAPMLISTPHSRARQERIVANREVAVAHASVRKVCAWTLVNP